MKLILTHEVSGLGEPGDVVEVKAGYGRNYLLPRNYAILWTRGAAKQVESIKKARNARAIHDLDDATALKQRLEASVVKVPARTGDGGRLFGAITVSDIASALEGLGSTVDKRRIEIGNPIKSVGDYAVSVRVHPDVTAKVKIQVVEAA
ncbi:large subunit ribosomal protein L9 [Mumia flava]|uniref:Large ribosomal subunit protein bL9 n=1 Tax=Mumia flava TaxID=1348852 RepID=A0A0B2B2L3_9ACTN|nr:50S ribosomal protein L9 [Mumia flava]PJJ57686.1 large subunit ribosomal protein L9 [Mumia flava]